MFKRIYVDNYKCLINFELPFQELTMLLGHNGSGKSAVLDVIFALQQLLQGVVKVNDPRIFPIESLTRWQDRNRQIFEIEVQLEQGGCTYRLEIEHNRHENKARIEAETLEAEGKPLFSCYQGEVQLYRSDHTEGPVFHVDWSESALARIAPSPNRSPVLLIQFMEFMYSVVCCRLQPANMDPEAKTEQQSLYRDGRNFAAWYRHVALERPELVPAFTEEVKQVIPDFSNLRLEQTGVDVRALTSVFNEGESRYELRFSELSDGQRALIVLYALVFLTKGGALLLDEPDNYMSLPEIQPWLLALEDSCGNGIAQAVLCTHHPELINYLGTKAGILLKHEDSGAARAVPLADEYAYEDSGLPWSELIARGWQK